MLTPDQRAAIKRSPSGKQRSARNAFRHGLTGQILVRTAEDLEGYHKFENSFRDFYQPENVIEVWKINRSSGSLNQILAQQSLQHDSDTGGLENNGPGDTAFAIASVDARCTRDLSNFSIFERAQDRLHMLQEARRQKDQTNLEEAAALLCLHQHQQEELAEGELSSEEAMSVWGRIRGSSPELLGGVALRRPASSALAQAAETLGGQETSSAAENMSRTLGTMSSALKRAAASAKDSFKSGAKVLGLGLAAAAVVGMATLLRA